MFSKDDIIQIIKDSISSDVQQTAVLQAQTSAISQVKETVDGLSRASEERNTIDRERLELERLKVENRAKVWKSILSAQGLGAIAIVIIILGFRACGVDTSGVGAPVNSLVPPVAALSPDSSGAPGTEGGR